MTTRKVEIISKEIRGTSKGTVHGGDSLSFPTEEATSYINLGWARDPETGEIGERRPGANGPIDIHKVTQPG